MLTLDNVIEKSCLIGLTYFSADGEMVKQSLLAGRVHSCDDEKGIGVTLFERVAPREVNTQPIPEVNEEKEFIIPSELSCWFTAPNGTFHTSVAGVTIDNPDFLVTWDIYQTRAADSEGQMQWWEWKPRIHKPVVGQESSN